MDSVTVRFAREGDAIFLPDVERSAAELFREAPGLAWIADDEVWSEEEHRASARDGMSWVAVDDADRPFGFLIAERYGDDLHIWEIAVCRTRQGQGAGRALLDAVFDHARRQGLTAVTLTTLRGVIWNEPFYARLGFQTLAADQMGDRLAGVLAIEKSRGLPVKQRCAMRLDLQGPRPRRADL